MTYFNFVPSTQLLPGFMGRDWCPELVNNTPSPPHRARDFPSMSVISAVSPNLLFAAFPPRLLGSCLGPLRPNRTENRQESEAFLAPSPLTPGHRYAGVGECGDHPVAVPVVTAVPSVGVTHLYADPDDNHQHQHQHQPPRSHRPQEHNCFLGVRNSF